MVLLWHSPIGEELSMARTTSAKTSTADKKKASGPAKNGGTTRAAASKRGDDGTEEVVMAVDELVVAGAMEDVAAAELAAGVAGPTPAAHAATGAARVGQLREGGGAAGGVDNAPGGHPPRASPGGG